MVVLPGDVVEHLAPQAPIRLGPGLKQEGDDVIAIKSGIVGHSEVGNRWWVENNQRKVCSTWNVITLPICFSIYKQRANRS